jgi:hypothetical protein
MASGGLYARLAKAQNLDVTTLDVQALDAPPVDPVAAAR